MESEVYTDSSGFEKHSDGLLDHQAGFEDRLEHDFEGLGRFLVFMQPLSKLQRPETGTSYAQDSMTCLSLHQPSPTMNWTLWSTWRPTLPEHKILHSSAESGGLQTRSMLLNSI